MIRLLDIAPVERGPRRTNSEAIEISSTRHQCPTCNASLTEVSHLQPALFYMYGHGGATHTTNAWCSRCGYHRHMATRTATPRVTT